MTIELFDVQAGFGGAATGQRTVPTADELLADMEAVDIGRALVRIAPERSDGDIPRSLDVLYAACDRSDALVPCPVVVPATAGDLPSEREQVDSAIARGAGAAVIRPGIDGWVIDEWCAGALFRALQARRLPVFCIEGQLSVGDVAGLAGRYPRLPLIYAFTNYRAQRMLVPLLAGFANTYLSMGKNYCVHLGIEQIAQVAGPDRVLFGTGWPEAEPMSAVTHLMYSALSDGAKALIGAGNLNRLVEEIER